ncbi:hypothetical protein GGX14DRAFT_403792 [Mycena pura]|uniref:Uncharacterized protein n=1 Tax=Mycena pura TaxID=153505 RepID=A0AAD6UVS2_9AGAR|nr:hypothetical protein GGX14DRAFT_403792 [Mycena pura]
MVILLQLGHHVVRITVGNAVLFRTWTNVKLDGFVSKRHNPCYQSSSAVLKPLRVQEGEINSAHVIAAAGAYNRQQSGRRAVLTCGENETDAACGAKKWTPRLITLIVCTRCRHSATLAVAALRDSISERMHACSVQLQRVLPRLAAHLAPQVDACAGGPMCRHPLPTQACTKALLPFASRQAGAVFAPGRTMCGGGAAPPGSWSAMASARGD